MAFNSAFKGLIIHRCTIADYFNTV